MRDKSLHLASISAASPLGQHSDEFCRTTFLPHRGRAVATIRPGNDTDRDMSALNPAASFSHGGDAWDQRDRRAPATAGRRYGAGGIILRLVVLPPLLAFLATAAWLVWLVAEDAFGRQGAILAVVALVAGVAGFSHHTGRGNANNLIMLGVTGLTLLIWSLSGLAAFSFVAGV